MSVTRLTSDVTSKDFRLAIKRKELFYNIAAKIIYRLQDSVMKFNETSTSAAAAAALDEKKQPLVKNRRASTRAASETVKTHKRYEFHFNQY